MQQTLNISCRMSKLLQELKSDINKSRNLSYYSKYSESVYEFNKVIAKMEAALLPITDRNLLAEWKKCLQEIRFERDVAINFQEMLLGNFEEHMTKPRHSIDREGSKAHDRTEDTRETSERDINRGRVLHNDESSLEMRNNYPFGKQPFKKQLHEDDQLYNSKLKRERELQEEQQRQFQKRNEEIWPKKKPVPKKTNISRSNANNSIKPSNGSVVNQSNKARDHDKPWRCNAKKKDTKDGTEERKSFLKSCYPDGQGPDAGLIEMLEKQVIDFNPDTTFEDIAELDKAKDVLEQAVLLPLLMPGIREAWKGVLLFGPPGTGKTLLAKAVASFGKTTFFSLTASSLASKWKGESEKLVRILFEMAKFYAPSTIFIDEIDALASKRGEREDESSRKVKTELMARIDGASNGKDESQLVIIGATNRPWDLDEAIRRRLQKRIYIPLPTQVGRRVMLKIKLKNFKTDELDLQEVVKKTEGFSGADIAILCKDAAMMPLRRKLKREGGLRGKNFDDKRREEFEKEANLPLTMEDFTEALKNAKPSVGKADMANFQEWMAEFGQRGTN